MFYFRTTKTSSGATAVQVVRYESRKLVIIKHIGSAHNPSEIISLKHAAAEWIQKTSRQQALFPLNPTSSSKLIALDKCKYLGFHYTLLYEVLNRLLIRFKFQLLRNKLLTDLVIARIIEPSSKVQSLEFLKEFLDVRHNRRDLYRQLPYFTNFKSKVESYTITLAKKEFNFNFSLVFYDVTTLYFESFKDDEFRKPGFSKDNKSWQPQILIGLIVNSEGFPVAYEVFEGNKFEGHTLIPVISAFKQRHKIEILTVVADAAMISLENIKALESNNLQYIVGARIGNLPLSLISDISRKLNQIDRKSLRARTKHGTLVCDFSLRRYTKDRREMERQIKKAETLLKNPSAIKRAKFLQNKSKANFEFNTELLKKSRLLLGIKGYYTNLSSEIDNDTIISNYHSLWHVEQAFRIAKSDLQMRPIYHFKKHTIEAHILICFMALAICKYMEIKTGKSIKKIVKLLRGVTDAVILDTLTNEKITLRSELKDETKQILGQIDV